VAIYLTNQVSSDPGGSCWKRQRVESNADTDSLLWLSKGGMTFVSDPKKPVGGHILAHA
jgi:hypothetical protein